MYPRLFDLGPITVYTYGVLLAAAYLLGLKFAMVRAQARGLDSVRVLDLGIYIIISALVGAKLLLLITDFRTFRADPAELLTLARSGGVFYGGLHPRGRAWRSGTSGVRGCRCGRPATCSHPGSRSATSSAGSDVSSPVAATAGRRRNRGALSSRDPFAAANVGTPLGVHLHPTQLYEAGAELLILGILLFAERKSQRFAGFTFWLYILLYAISRYIIEIFRGDERGTIGMFSTSQFISLVLAPLAIAMLLYLARRKEPTPKSARKRAA